MAVSWLSINPTTGENGETKLALTRAENGGRKVRKATIMFKPTDGETGLLGSSCSVTQAATPAFFKSLEDAKIISFNGQDVTLNFKSNVTNFNIMCFYPGSNFPAEKDFVTFKEITINEIKTETTWEGWNKMSSPAYEVPDDPGAKKTYDIILVLTFSKNPLLSSRKANITIAAQNKNDEGIYDSIDVIYGDAGKSELAITQEASTAQLIVNPQTISLDASAGTEEDKITVISNISWSSEIQILE